MTIKNENECVTSSQCYSDWVESCRHVSTSTIDGGIQARVKENDEVNYD